MSAIVAISGRERVGQLLTIASELRDRRTVLIARAVLSMGVELPHEVRREVREVGCAISWCTKDALEVLALSDAEHGWGAALDLLCRAESSRSTVSNALEVMSSWELWTERADGAVARGMAVDPERTIGALIDVGVETPAFRLNAVEILSGLLNADRALAPLAAEGLLRLSAPHLAADWARQAAASDSARERSEAGSVLAALGDADADRWVWKLMNDDEPMVRTAVETACVEHRIEPGRPLSVDGVDPRNVSTEESARVMRRQLASAGLRIDEVWRGVVEAPGPRRGVDDWEGVEALIDAVKLAPWYDPPFHSERLWIEDTPRALALYFAGQMDPLTPGRGPPTEVVRAVQATCDALSRRTDWPESARRYLADLAESDNGEVRILALDALLKRGNWTDEQVERALRDSDPWVRRRVFWWLQGAEGRTAGQAHPAWIRTGLADDDVHVRGVAAAAAGATGRAEFARQLALMAVFGEAEEAWNVGRLGAAGVEAVVTLCSRDRLRHVRDGVLGGVHRWVQDGGSVEELGRVSAELQTLVFEADHASPDVLRSAVRSPEPPYRLAALLCGVSGVGAEVFNAWDWESESDEAVQLAGVWCVAKGATAPEAGGRLLERLASNGTPRVRAAALRRATSPRPSDAGE